MRKLFYTLVTALTLSTAASADNVATHIEITDAGDSRVTIQLNESETDLILLEMRIFLQSVQLIVNGITNDDMEQVSASARKSGRSAQLAVAESLAAKLPLAFKKLGFDTHAKFDALALDAEQLGDNEHTLSQLSTLLENCVSCHAAFKFDTSSSTAK